MIPTNDLVTVISVGELDDWGRPTQEIINTYPCRIDYSTEIVRTSNGEEKVSKATILIKGSASITVNDVIRWTDFFGEHEQTPLSVSPIKDLSSKVLFTKVVV